MLEAALIFARFLHYGSLMVLFGASLFPIYSYTSERPIPFFEACWLSSLTLAASLVGLVSAVLWLALMAAMLTDSLSSAVNPQMISLILGRTEFGEVWVTRLCMSVLLSAALMVWVGTPMVDRRSFQYAQAAAAAYLLASLAFIGHAQFHVGVAETIHSVSDAIHLLGAAAWFGALAPLGLALQMLDHGEATNNFDAKNAVRLMLRFSTLGYLALGVVTITGLINSWFLVGSLNGLVETEYGRWLMVKVVLVVSLAVGVATGRMTITPRLAAGKGPPGRWIRQVQGYVMVEQGAGLVIIAFAAVIGMLPPAAT